MTTFSISQVVVTAITLSASFAYADVEPLIHDSGDMQQPVLIAQQTSPDKPGASSKDMEKQMQPMQEHMQSMREHMKMMHETGGCMMMGPMARGDQPGAGKPERGMGCRMMMGANPGHRQEMLEQRMDMMQMMMDQMMQNLEAAQAKPK